MSAKMSCTDIIRLSGVIAADQLAANHQSLLPIRYMWSRLWVMHLRGRMVYVRDERGEIVACVVASDTKDAGLIEISTVFVRRDHRRNGLMPKMFERCLDLCRHHPCIPSNPRFISITSDRGVNERLQKMGWKIGEMSLYWDVLFDRDDPQIGERVLFYLPES